MGTWMSPELVLVVLVALCAVVILAGVMRLLSRRGREARGGNGAASRSGPRSRP